MHNRRQILTDSFRVAALLAGAGLMPAAVQAAWSQPAFNARSMTEAVRALGGSAPRQSSYVALSGPDIAGSGAVVPVGCSCSQADVKRMLLLVEENPTALAAVFEPGPSVEPRFLTRVKMLKSSNVFAVAMMTDGTVLYAQKTIQVALGGTDW